ncbi:MAG: hypothetical protein PHQ94_08270 [Syntrophomonas sp.]|nr:hypothetical protein [Syntrophomonas sp.]
MILLLKIISLAIWFIIMLFIIEAVFHRKKKPVKNLGPYLCNKAENAGQFHTEREKA